MLYFYKVNIILKFCKLKISILEQYMYFTELSTPLGQITIESDGTYLTGLWFVGQKYYGLAENAIFNDNLPIFIDVKNKLEAYFNGKYPNFNNIPLKPKGSPFRRQVWKHLSELPYGTTTTYGEIAKKIANENGLKTMSAQAVGGAVGHNPISIIIPCHRVLGKDNSLTGYAGGLDKKIALLKLEGSAMAHTFSHWLSI